MMILEHGRDYGYKRKHLGHDMMGNTGTPIIATESGIVEELGWNRYGGWRIGIRSFDTKRYYYYAHLRKDSPYVKDLAKGQIIKAGDVIGYMGRTGYSIEENISNIETTHLHFGLQLIFDEVQKDGINQIWIDVYQIAQLLQQNRSKVQKVSGTKEYKRVYDIYESNLSIYGRSIEDTN
ncbi:MAG: M23 family metallopeptidase [Clostridia bacterium]|nr:M23 family metallopeptidase [Clostridia bacterium]MDD4386583.1 M23 family metallopeptidase [Clostridia bacterium]